ncbi:hypothetical protein M422DRAFT_31997, partial [Sphaerobolus stellatus SS14]
MDLPYTVPSSPILHHPSASCHIPHHPVTILRGISGSSSISWPWILVCPQISLSILRATPFLRYPQGPGISFQLPETHWDPPETQKELKTVW